MRADYPFEYRWLGDNSVTEGYAMLFDHLHAGQRVAAALHGARTRRECRSSCARAGFEELHFLRRYCAKLIYELAALRRRRPWDALPDLYVEQLTAATTFRVQRRADAFVDVDPRFYCRALSARVAAAGGAQRIARGALRRGLVPQPARGAVDRARAVGEGQRESAEEIAARVGVGGEGLSFGPLARNIEKLLEA